LEKREGAIKKTESFLQELAGEENKSKGLSSKSRSNHISKRRRLRYSKRQLSKVEPTQEVRNFEESPKEIVDAIRMLQRRKNGSSADERRWSSIAKMARTGLSYSIEANHAVIKRPTLSDPSLRGK